MEIELTTMMWYADHQLRNVSSFTGRRESIARCPLLSRAIADPATASPPQAVVGTSSGI